MTILQNFETAQNRLFFQVSIRYFHKGAFDEPIATYLVATHNLKPSVVNLSS